jgi:N-acyl homoserine lactone hydrolase
VAEYSIWVVEYARVAEFARGILMYGDWNTGTTVAPYSYAVIKGEGHLDHAGGVEFFPNAHVYFQAREVSKYLWATSQPDRLQQWLTTAVDPDLMLWLVNRMKRRKLTLLEGESEILPGVRIVPAHDTHTAGSQYVTVDAANAGRFVLAGDNCYVYENFTGRNGDGRFVPIGLVFGSVERCVMTMEEMWQYVAAEPSRIVPFHEQKLWEQFPSRQFEDTLHVAELALAAGERSRVEAAVAAG